MLPAKIYRALLSRDEETQEDQLSPLLDSKISAYIALNSVVAIGEALVNLAEQEPSPKIVRLARLSVNIARLISLEFDLEDKNRLA